MRLNLNNTEFVRGSYQHVQLTLEDGQVHTFDTGNPVVDYHNAIEYAYTVMKEGKESKDDFFISSDVDNFCMDDDYHLTTFRNGLTRLMPDNKRTYKEFKEILINERTKSLNK